MNVCEIYRHHHSDTSVRHDLLDKAGGRPVLPDMASGGSVLPKCDRIDDMSLTVTRRLKPPVFSARIPTVGNSQCCTGLKNKLRQH